MYGTYIKKIRNNKDLTINSIYDGVCSKTNALKFENGERMLSADKFNKVLQNLMISMEEFLLIRNEYQPSMDVYHQYMVGKNWNQDNEKNIKKYFRILESKAVKVERVQLASYRLLEEFKNEKDSTKKELNIVINYFVNLRSWTITDLKFFANNCYVLPYNLMIALLVEVVGSIKLYKYFQNTEVLFATILVNCINRMINRGDIANSELYLTKLRKLSKGISMNGYFLLYKYYQAKLVFLYFDNKEGYKKLEEVLYIANYFENNQVVNEIKKILEYHKKDKK